VEKNLEEVKRLFQELTKTSQKVREREITDHNAIELLNNTDKEKKR